MIRIPGGVLCCGNLVQDILVRPVAEVVFDRTTWVESIQFSLGGNGANTAYSLAMLGAPVRLLGFTGEDEFGERVLGTLRNPGVDVSRVVRVADEATATTVVLVHPTGSRAFLHQPGVNRTAFREPVVFSQELVGDATHFHLGNPFGLVELRSRAGLVMKSAREAGLTTSIDTGWDARGQWLDVVGPCLPFTDILFVNEDESRMLSGATDPAVAARFFFERGVKSVVTKVGARGCIVFEGSDERHVPGFCIDAVDSTGAGDSFVGGFLGGLYHGMTALEAARFGNAAGALSASSLGAVSGLLPFAETVAWIQRADVAAHSEAGSTKVP